jgi:Protein of unknown function (DUF3631)
MAFQQPYARLPSERSSDFSTGKTAAESPGLVTTRIPQATVKSVAPTNFLMSAVGPSEWTGRARHATGFNNRLGDNWELLLAIADFAGSERPTKARTVAVKLSNVAEVLPGDHPPHITSDRCIIGRPVLSDGWESPRQFALRLGESIRNESIGRHHFNFQ